jgi:hypothetical protein
MFGISAKTIAIHAAFAVLAVAAAKRTPLNKWLGL